MFEDMEILNIIEVEVIEEGMDVEFMEEECKERENI